MEQLKDKNPLKMEILVQGPGQAAKELVIAGFFEYEESEPELIGGAKQLNDGLKGAIMDIRKARTDFSGVLGESHLFKSPINTIPGENVLLVGLGKLNEFTNEIAKEFGSVAMKAAHETKFRKVCLAPEIKDAGVKPYHGTPVTISLIQGIMTGYQELIDAGEEIHIQKFVLLAGKANKEKAKQGLRAGLDKYFLSTV